MSKSPSLRRIQADVRELALDPSDRYYAAPLEHDMFEWHFTIRGADGTEFEGGVYHGRILLPPEYPFKPPHIVFLTPSGRFETNTKVCLSFSAYHPELWQPAWGIRLILEALISFLPTPADGAIGSLDWSSPERKRLAKLSQQYSCPTCGKKAIDLLPNLGEKKNHPASRFAKEIAELQRLQQATEGNKTSEDADEAEATNSNDSEETAPASKDETPSGTPENTAETVEEAVVTPTDDDPASMVSSSADEPPCPANAGETNEVDPKITEEDAPAAATTAADNAAVAAEAVTMGALDAAAAANISWMYDPLMNLMMILLAIICYLLLQKYRELTAELNELRSGSA